MTLRICIVFCWRLLQSLKMSQQLSDWCHELYLKFIVLLIWLLALTASQSVTYSVWFWTCCIGAGLLDRYLGFTDNDCYFSVRRISVLFGANIHEWFLQVFTITVKYLNICKRDCYNIWYRWSWFPEDESSWLWVKSKQVYVVQSVIWHMT